MVKKTSEENIQALFRAVDKAFPMDYTDIDRENIENWMFENYGKKGLEMYFRYEDLKILKGMGLGVSDREYWMMTGRRLQILYLMNEVRRTYENRKSREQKRKDVKERKRKNG